MEEGLFHNPVFVQYINEFAVAAVGHQEAHSEVEAVDPATGAKRQVCPRYNTIPCSSHQKTYASTGGKFDFKYVPSSFVCDSGGKLVKKVDGQSPQAFIDALTEAQQASGKKPITGSMLAKWDRDLQKGDMSLTKGKLKAAHKSYETVATDESAPEFMRERGQERIAALTAAIEKAIADAKADDPKKGAKALKKLMKELKDMPELLKAAEEALASLDG